MGSETRVAGDSLGDRMKACYEAPWRAVLPRRIPVIIRVDGKAFHTLTRGLQPFDAGFMDSMDSVAMAMCDEIQGSQMAFVQSDEVSVLVHGYRTIQSEPWLGNGVQKMASVSASIATAAFNESFRYYRPAWRIATFDARVFCMPEDEACNYFIWRQKDWTRNSIQMTAQGQFSQKQLHGLSCEELQEMLFSQKGINWNDLSPRVKRGRCAIRHTFERDGAVRHEWRIDNEIPVFTKDRQYVERFVRIHEEEGVAR